MKKGERRRANAAKNAAKKKPRKKKTRYAAVNEALAIDLALAFFSVAIKHGLIGPLPTPANEGDFKLPPFAGGKLQ
jgi:hypothetical protein